VGFEVTVPENNIEPARAALASESLVERAMDLAVETGRNPTPWPRLSVHRHDVPGQDEGEASSLTICAVIKGRKVVRVDERSLEYGPYRFLVLSLPQPYTGSVVEHPYLSLSISLPADLVAEQALEIARDSQPSDELGPAGYVGDLDPGMRDALARLFDAALDDRRRDALCPVVETEIVRRLLVSPASAPLRAAAAGVAQTRPLVEVMRYMRDHCHERLTVEDLARKAGMSTSSFAHGFKALTRTSPIRFVKHVRLEKARLLLLRDGLNASEAAYRVGYKSSSQFSNDFRRQYGESPGRYAARFSLAPAGGSRAPT